VLCAVARELGVTDRRQQVRLLGAVMCDRELGGQTGEDREHASDEAPAVEWTPKGLGEALWQLAGLMRAIGDELVKRPRPRSVFRYLGMLPAAGAVADYLGEYGALVRASKEGRQWISQHPVVVPAWIADARQCAGAADGELEAAAAAEEDAAAAIDDDATCPAGLPSEFPGDFADASGASQFKDRSVWLVALAAVFSGGGTDWSTWFVTRQSGRATLSPTVVDTMGV
jgi:hypothetical protein